MYLRHLRPLADLEDKAGVEEDIRRASLGQRWSRSTELLPLPLSRLVWGMFCWEVTEKRRGDTTIPRNVAINFGFSYVLREVSPIVTSQDIGQLRGRLEGLLCIASKIMGYFRAFVTKT
jgi:hypothetical protein